MPDPQTTNCLTEAAEMDPEAIKRAVEFLRDHKPVDCIKQIEISRNGLHALKTSTGILTVDVENKMMGNLTIGIRIVESNAVPEDWALLTHQSGNKVMLNVKDGRSLVIPRLPEPEVTFEPRT